MRWNFSTFSSSSSSSSLITELFIIHSMGMLYFHFISFHFIVYTLSQHVQMLDRVPPYVHRSTLAEEHFIIIILFLNGTSSAKSIVSTVPHPHPHPQQPHHPLKSNNPSGISPSTAPAAASTSSMSSKLFFFQKSCTPATNLLLVFSTSDSSTAAKHIRTYDQPLSSRTSSVGEKIVPGETRTRYFSVVRCTQRALASFPGKVVV